MIDLQYQTFIFLGSYAECYFMYMCFVVVFFVLQSLYLWSFVCTLCHLTCGFVSLLIPFICVRFFFSFCAACQTYCIWKDVSCILIFWNKLNIMMSDWTLFLFVLFHLPFLQLNFQSDSSPPSCRCFKKPQTKQVCLLIQQIVSKVLNKISNATVWTVNARLYIIHFTQMKWNMTSTSTEQKYIQKKHIWHYHRPMASLLSLG